MGVASLGALQLLGQFEALRECLASTAPRWAPMKGGYNKCMLACYPRGSRYVRHRDVSPLCPERVATAIVYLNHEWAGGDGGEVRLFPDSTDAADDGHSSSVLVAPTLGRLVVFDSRTEHEVRHPSRTLHTLFALKTLLGINFPPFS